MKYPIYIPLQTITNENQMLYIILMVVASYNNDKNINSYKLVFM